jgi:hypothetical protein
MLNSTSQTVSSTSTDVLKYNPELFKKSQFCSVCCRCMGEFFYTLPSQYCKVCYYEYIKELQDEDKEPQIIKKKEIKSFKKLTEEEEYQKAESYGNIKLIFGKYKDMSLNQILALDKDVGTNYLRWLYGSMEQDKTRKKTPTQMAIMKYINLVVGV